MTDSSQPAARPEREASITRHELPLPDHSLRYTATAAWQQLFDRDKPVAEMFYVAYLAEDEGASRPITFVFNGGPGAASAYLHMGALGPKRVYFEDNGALPKPPVQVLDNVDTWLSFTDLVFIDPIGTGFSRSIDDEKPQASHSATPTQAAPEKPESDPPREIKFWEVKRDLNALGEFIQQFLSRHHRWLSPIFIAGESYGGFRVARLARVLQQDFGVGLSGAILISPALEFSLLGGSDYSLTAWATVFPSLAATAAYHQKAQWAGAVGDVDGHRKAAEQFARRTLLPLLAMGGAIADDERQETYGAIANFLGLPLDLVERHHGRIDLRTFSRELLRDQRRIVGVYDASITAIDPFPNRLQYEGSDPTLDGLNRLFTGAINSHLRDTLGVDTSLTYHLLNFEVFKAWKYLLEGEWKQGYVGSVDDLRVGMTLNPYMKVYVVHGIYDLVTPYFASNHLADLMKLDPDIRPNLITQHFEGGHMFYTWEKSRKQWLSDMQDFYRTAIA
ncbi:MAG: peptidase S10 [Leptolyngbyaceae bacterium]|nr:peptidase S10 [Leptolyngbyaceae bacterium]